jgi:hypothetical protein
MLPVVRANLIIESNEGRCSLCPNVRFIAGAKNETVSIMKQFEAHCRKFHSDHQSSQDSHTASDPDR